MGFIVELNDEPGDEPGRVYQGKVEWRSESVYIQAPRYGHERTGEFEMFLIPNLIVKLVEGYCEREGIKIGPNVLDEIAKRQWRPPSPSYDI